MHFCPPSFASYQESLNFIKPLKFLFPVALNMFVNSTRPEAQCEHMEGGHPAGVGREARPSAFITGHR